MMRSANKREIPLSQFENMDLTNVDMVNTDVLNVNLATAAMTNIHILDSSSNNLILAQSMGLCKDKITGLDYLSTAHARPISQEGIALLDQNIEEVDLSSIKDMDSLQEMKKKLELASDTQKSLQSHAECLVSANRMQIIEVARYLRTERETMDKILEHAPYQVDELSKLRDEIKDSPYIKAESWFMEKMNSIALEKKKYHIRKSNNLGEAWDNAAGSIEVSKEDSEILQKQQENIATKIGISMHQQSVMEARKAQAQNESMSLRNDASLRALTLEAKPKLN